MKVNSSTRNARGMARIHLLVGCSVAATVLTVTLPRSIESGADTTFSRQHLAAENAARSTFTNIRNLSFQAVGVGTPATHPPYLGFHETNAARPGFTLGEDRYFSDVIMLADHIVARRQVVVRATPDDAIKRVEVVVTWDFEEMPRSIVQRGYIQPGAAAALADANKV